MRDQPQQYENKSRQNETKKSRKSVKNIFYWLGFSGEKCLRNRETPFSIFRLTFEWRVNSIKCQTESQILCIGIHIYLIHHSNWKINYLWLTQVMERMTHFDSNFIRFIYLLMTPIFLWSVGAKRLVTLLAHHCTHTHKLSLCVNDYVRSLQMQSTAHKSQLNLNRWFIAHSPDTNNILISTHLIACQRINLKRSSNSNVHFIIPNLCYYNNRIKNWISWAEVKKQIAYAKTANDRQAKGGNIKSTHVQTECSLVILLRLEFDSIASNST